MDWARWLGNFRFSIARYLAGVTDGVVFDIQTSRGEGQANIILSFPLAVNIQRGVLPLTIQKRCATLLKWIVYQTGSQGVELETKKEGDNFIATYLLDTSKPLTRVEAFEKFRAWLDSRGVFANYRVSYRNMFMSLRSAHQKYTSKALEKEIERLRDRARSRGLDLDLFNELVNLARETV